jgi:hypothetical protein
MFAEKLQTAKTKGDVKPKGRFHLFWLKCTSGKSAQDTGKICDQEEMHNVNIQNIPPTFHQESHRQLPCQPYIISIITQRAVVVKSMAHL